MKELLAEMLRDWSKSNGFDKKLGSPGICLYRTRARYRDLIEMMMGMWSIYIGDNYVICKHWDDSYYIEDGIKLSAEDPEFLNKLDKILCNQKF